MANATQTAYRTVGTYGYGEPVRIYAVWGGGMYIDLAWYSANGPVFEVINVYDYRAGKVQDDVNVSRELTEWIKATGKAEIANYFRHTA